MKPGGEIPIILLMKLRSAFLPAVWVLAAGLEAAAAEDGPAGSPEKVIDVERIPWPVEAHALEMFSALTVSRAWSDDRVGGRTRW